MKGVAGTVTLTGSNTYAGSTIVEAWTLALSSSGALRAGGLSLAAGTVSDLTASSQAVFTVPAGLGLSGLATSSWSGKTLAVLGGPLSPAFTIGPYADGENVPRLLTNTGLMTGGFTWVIATGLEPGQSATFDAVTGFVSIVPEPVALTGVAVAAWTDPSSSEGGRGLLVPDASAAADVDEQRGRVMPPQDDQGGREEPPRASVLLLKHASDASHVRSVARRAHAASGRRFAR